MSWIKTDQPRQPPRDPPLGGRSDPNASKHSDPFIASSGHATGHALEHSNIAPSQTSRSPDVRVSLDLGKNTPPQPVHSAVQPPIAAQSSASTSPMAMISHRTDAHGRLGSLTEYHHAAVKVPSSWRAPLLHAGQWQALPAIFDTSAPSDLNTAIRATMSPPPHLTMAVFQSAGQVQLFLQHQRDAALQAILQLKPLRGDNTLWQWQASPAVDIPELLRQLHMLTPSSAPQQPWLRAWITLLSQATSYSPTTLYSPTTSANTTTNMAQQPATPCDLAMHSDAEYEAASPHLRRSEPPTRKQQMAEDKSPTLGNAGTDARNTARLSEGGADHELADASPLQRLAQQIHSALQQRWQQSTSQLAAMQKDKSWLTNTALTSTFAAHTAPSTASQSMTEGSVQSTKHDTATSTTMSATSSQPSTELNTKRLSRADLQPYWQFLANTVTGQDASSLQHHAAELLPLLQSQQEQALKSPLALLLLGANMSPTPRSAAATPPMLVLSQAAAQQAAAPALPVSDQSLPNIASDPVIEHLLSPPTPTQRHISSATEPGTPSQRQQLLDFIKQQLLDSMRFQPMLTPDAALHTGAAALAGNIGMMLRLLLGRSAPGTVASTTTAQSISTSRSPLPSSPQTPQTPQTPQPPSLSHLPALGADIPSLKEKLAAMDKLELSAGLRQLAKLSHAIQVSQLNHAEHTMQSAEQKNALASWHITLPLAVAPEPCSVSISIQEQLSQQATQSSPRRWQLKLNFDLASQGQMLALLTLQDVELDLQIYCDSIALRQQVQTLLPTLSARLHQQGLWLLDIQCHLGKIPSVQFPKPSTSFDTKA